MERIRDVPSAVPKKEDRRDDDRGHHESDGMAAAFRAWLLRRRGSQEAGADAVSKVGDQSTYRIVSDARQPG
jgi:hypothetical protein